MTLSHRERVLAGVVGVLGVAVVAWLLFGVFSGPLETRRDELAGLTGELNAKQEEVLAAKKAQDQLAQWNRQALPWDVVRGGSLYQNWLLELAGKAGFRQYKVDPREARARGDSYTQLPFDVRGQATLDQLIQFLFKFYSAGHLHKIRTITVKPVEKGKELDLVIVIEALSLPKADRKDQLSKEESKRLALASVEDYRKAITGRNILGPYQPPRATKSKKDEEKGPPFDPSKYAFVTAIVQVGGRPQVWVKARTTDEKFQLQQGEKLTIGPFQATIARINARDVEIEIDGQRHTIPLGGNIRGGEASDTASAESEAKPAESGGEKGPEPSPERTERKSSGKRTSFRTDSRFPRGEPRGESKREPKGDSKSEATPDAKGDTTSVKTDAKPDAYAPKVESKN
jgi:hypothetical protein